MPHESDKDNDDWTPYRDQVQFEVTDFLYCQNQMSAGDINFVTGLWAASLAPHNDSLPFKIAKDIYNTINATPLGNVPWQSFTMNYKGSQPETLGPEGEVPPWTTADYNIMLLGFLVIPKSEFIIIIIIICLNDINR